MYSLNKLGTKSMLWTVIWIVKHAKTKKFFNLGSRIKYLTTVLFRVILIFNSLHENPLVQRPEASELEVRPVKTDNQKSDWRFVLIKHFMIYFRGPVKIIGGQ
jgi:hypothetical protein